MKESIKALIDSGKLVYIADNKCPSCGEQSGLYGYTDEDEPRVEYCLNCGCNTWLNNHSPETRACPHFIHSSTEKPFG